MAGEGKFGLNIEAVYVHTDDGNMPLLDYLEGSTAAGPPGKDGTDGKDGARGSRLWTTTGITGTSTDGTVFADSGISGAIVYDYALNRSTGNLYVCSKGGDAATAEWKYDTNLKGPKGDPGADGTDGTDGSPGADGADGFPTEEQWTTLVARVEALETPEA